MSQSISIRRSLLGNILLILVLLASAIMGVTFYGSNETTKVLSRSLITRTIDEVESRLKLFIEPILDGLKMAKYWGEKGLIPIDNATRCNHLFFPFLQAHSQFSSQLLANELGQEYMLLRGQGKWINRLTDVEKYHHRVRWLEWQNLEQEPIATWKSLQYDPRNRPWYQSTLEEVGANARNAAQDAFAPEQVHWTKPYLFFTSGKPGITASVAFFDENHIRHVLGIDVLLSDISLFTTRLNVSKNGKIVVLTDDGRIIGLPNDARFRTEAAIQASLLKKPDELGITLASDAAKAFARAPDDWRDPIRFVSEKQAWWGQLRLFPLSAKQNLIIAVMVPEDDFLGGMARFRIWILFLTLFAMIIAIERAFAMARRFSRPIEALVQQTEEMSRGNMEPLPATRSNIEEVKQLSEAHDRMRVGLKSLMKLERDLQLAKQIQEGTFPKELPSVVGYELAVWSAPAEDTGGDTYDVIGVDETADGTRVIASEAQSIDKVVFLLGDATGHGIGPALSVTQVRSMLRMALRSGEQLDAIIAHLNDQLYADLHGGRFVTAWIGELDKAANRLSFFSAGQAPFLHYQAETQHCTQLAADSPPLGVLDSIDTQVMNQLHLDSGDIFAIFSDGIYDSVNEEGEGYGVDRVQQLVQRYAKESADTIIQQLQKDLDKFTQNVKASDDRTAIILKRQQTPTV